MWTSNINNNIICYIQMECMCINLLAHACAHLLYLNTEPKVKIKQ